MLSSVIFKLLLVITIFILKHKHGSAAFEQLLSTILGEANIKEKPTTYNLRDGVYQYAASVSKKDRKQRQEVLEVNEESVKEDSRYLSQSSTTKPILTNEEDRFRTRDTSNYLEVTIKPNTRKAFIRDEVSRALSESYVHEAVGVDEIVVKVKKGTYNTDTTIIEIPEPLPNPNPNPNPESQSAVVNSYQDYNAVPVIPHNTRDDTLVALSPSSEAHANSHGVLSLAKEHSTVPISTWTVHEDLENVETSVLKNKNAMRKDFLLSSSIEWVQQGGDIDGEAAGDYSGWSMSLSSDGTVVSVNVEIAHGHSTNRGWVGR